MPMVPASCRAMEWSTEPGAYRDRCAPAESEHAWGRVTARATRERAAKYAAERAALAFPRPAASRRSRLELACLAERAKRRFRVPRPGFEALGSGLPVASPTSGS